MYFGNDRAASSWNHCTLRKERATLFYERPRKGKGQAEAPFGSVLSKPVPALSLFSIAMFSSLLIPNTTAFEGALLFLIALAAVYFLRPVNTRRRATWFLAIFFVCMALLGFTRILEGTAGGTVFAMIEDTFIILGGLFLVQFAYAFPSYDQPGEARWVAVAYCLLVALAAATILVLVADTATTTKHYIEYPRFFHYLMPLAISVSSMS